MHAHRAPINSVQAQARVRVTVRHGAADGDVVVDEDILPALGIREDRLAAGRVDVAVGCEHERAPSVPQILAGCIEERTVRRRGAADKHLVLVPGWGECGSAEAATQTWWNGYR